MITEVYQVCKLYVIWSIISVFAELFDFGITGDLREAPEFGGLMGRARPKQDPDQESPLLLTLEEVYRGCTKKAKVNRMVCIPQRSIPVSLGCEMTAACYQLHHEVKWPTLAIEASFILWIECTSRYTAAISYGTPCISVWQYVNMRLMTVLQLTLPSIQTLNEDRRTSTVREKILTIHVPPGTQEGTKFRFQKEGDQKVNNIPGECGID